jgi:hypothetical protein
MGNWELFLHSYWSILSCSPFNGTDFLSCISLLQANCFAYHLLALAPCSAKFFTLKMEATCYSETSIGFQRTTRRYVPGDRIRRSPCGVTFTQLSWCDLTNLCSRYRTGKQVGGAEPRVIILQILQDG